MSKSNVKKVVIRFAGDSGDGIQLIGDQISNSSVLVSENDIYTFVDFPAEIRAPAGSLSGVSGFQISISNEKIYFIENNVDLLVSLNPAALKSSIDLLKNNSILIVDSDSFNDKNLKRAGFLTNPLIDNSLDKYKLIKIPITKLTYECVKNIISSVSKAKRCKNFFVLGLVCWIYDRDINIIISWIEKKFKSKDIFNANKSALHAGYNYGYNLEILQNQIIIPPSNLYKDSMVTKISGNKAFSIGALASSFLLNMPLFSANYPITPASDIMHNLCLYANNEFKIIQMEDEIAAINAAIGASYGGALAFSCTSGPGLDLMQEGIGLSIMAELPILILNIQRSGPSTGIPTKSEQTDLFASIFGRHGESSVIVLAANSPSDCFWSIIEGFMLAIISRGPVIVLSDANIANSSELWKIPSIHDINHKFKIILNKLQIDLLVKSDKKHNKNLWEKPGESGNESCIGGLERDIETGDVSHNHLNHEKMVKKRFDKINNVINFYQPLEILGNRNGDFLIITWGSVYGIVRSIYNDIYKNFNISLICLRYINPLPIELKDILYSFKNIIIIEENLGQLAYILRANYHINTININQVTGKPFDFTILKNKILNYIS